MRADRFGELNYTVCVSAIKLVEVLTHGLQKSNANHVVCFFTSHISLCAGQTAMFRVLIAYAQSDPAVGYCQVR